MENEMIVNEVNVIENDENESIIEEERKSLLIL